MSPSPAFSLSERDIEKVLRANLPQLANSDDKPIETLAQEIFNGWEDLDRVAKAALFAGPNLDKQTEAAHAEIRSILMDNRILKRVRVSIEVLQDDGKWMYVDGHGCDSEESAKRYMQLAPHSMRYTIKGVTVGPEPKPPGFIDSLDVQVMKGAIGRLIARLTNKQPAPTPPKP